MNADGSLNLEDPQQWLAVAGAVNLPDGRAFQFGDANLDGAVDGLDFISWNAHKFTANAAWCDGDFDADGIVDGQDFLIWNEHKFSGAVANLAVSSFTWSDVPTKQHCKQSAWERIQNVLDGAQQRMPASP